MGVAASHSSDRSSTNTGHTSMLVQQTPVCDEPIHREQFMTRFCPELESLGLAIWHAYSEDSRIMKRADYNRLLARVRSSTDDLTFFLDLFGDDFTIKDLTSIISWMTFGIKVDNDLLSAVLKPLNSLFTSSPVHKEDLSRRMKTIFPDVGSDLMRVVCCRATGEPAYSSLGFTASSPFTKLLKPDIFWVLSCVLSVPYKRVDSSSRSKGQMLEIEQLRHLKCLYSSTTNGFGFSKLKELAFDYRGPLILLLKTQEYLFCLASDEGISDSVKAYGGEDTILFRILPEFTKLVSGRLSTGSKKNGNGVIFSNFTAKTVQRGLMVGHQPLISPAIAVDDGFCEVRFAGGAPTKLTAVEVWAAGSDVHLKHLTSLKDWESNQVNKEKNRKIKSYDQWQDSADRNLLDLAGINVYNSSALPPEEPHSNG